MPRKDIWIRKEDLARWEAIEDKPEWIHRYLSLHNSPLLNPAASEVTPASFKPTPPPVKDVADVREELIRGPKKTEPHINFLDKKLKKKR